MAATDMIYRMTVLGLLDHAKTALSNTQITDFFHDTKYTGYFTVQQIISDLLENGLVASEATRNQTFYRITPEGEKTLSLFADRLTPSIREDIDRYFREKGLEIRNENSLTANYDKALGGGYIVHLKLTEREQTKIDLQMNVPSQAQAEAMCLNWKVRSEEVFAVLMDTLVS